MIPELGHFALIVALLVAATQGIVPMLGAARNHRRMMALARPAARMQFVLVAIAFACLAWSFASNDFSVQNVAANSNSELPLHYRIAATWGSHEGSLLLWALMLAGWSCAVSVFSRNLPDALAARVLSVMGLVSVGFLLFLLFTSNPFARLLPPAPEGRDLNPLLQDPGMVFHPPLLYMGYVGFSVAFAFALAALIGGRLDATWARWSRPWTTVAWAFLTTGIALGSGWAYYTLGWGGWWFWDPVENASFMPWLTGTALIHSLAVTEKRGAFRSWTVLLAILAFSLSLLGTFLVRSGVITSVHSFASDPTRGFFILVLIALAVGGALALFAWRAPSLQGGTAFEPVSRESALLLNNIFLIAACAAVFVGTLYPLALDAATGQKISVGPPYYAITFAPIFFALLALVPLGPRLAWRKGDLKDAIKPLYPSLGVAAVAIIAVLALASPRSLAGAGAFAMAGWLLASSVIEIRKRKGARVAAFAAAIAHAGLAVSLIGIAGTTVWRSEALVLVGPGETLTVGPYTLRFNGVTQVDGPNYRGSRASIDLMDGARVKAAMHPELRIFTAQGQDVSVTAIRTTGLDDLYLALGDDRGNGRWTLRAYVSPLAPLIWLGALVMALGGGLSLAGRLRARAPEPKAAPAVAMAAE